MVYKQPGIGLLGTVWSAQEYSIDKAKVAQDLPIHLDTLATGDAVWARAS